MFATLPEEESCLSALSSGGSHQPGTLVHDMLSSSQHITVCIWSHISSYTHTEQKQKRDRERGYRKSWRGGREERRRGKGNEQKGEERGRVEREGGSRKKRGDGNEGGDKDGLMEKRKRRLREEGKQGVR